MQSFKFILIGLVLFCYGCQSKYHYESFESIGHQKWMYADTINFEVEITDSNSVYNFYVLPRHTVAYPYMNLWIMITTVYPNNEIREQRIEIPMADKSGKWFGKGVGALKLIGVSIIQNVKLRQSGKYVFKITQDMRYEPITNIRDMGFRVEKIIP